MSDQVGAGPGRLGATDAAQRATASDQVAADRRTVRRALRAGTAVAGAVAALGVVGNEIAGGDGGAALVWVSSAIVVGTLISAGWLTLAMVLDLVAGIVPGPRRAAWTAALFALAFISPVLPAAALQVAATS